jgi:enediyne biosynthesis protein E4
VRSGLPIVALALVLAGCPDPEPLGDDDDDTLAPGEVVLTPLAEPVHVAGLPLFYSPEEAGLELGIDHVTRLAFDPDDRWLDDFSGGLAVLDCDGDLDPDLLLTSSDGANSMWLNDGAGAFTRHADAGVAFDGDVTASASAADIEGDGDVDVVLLNQFQANRVLLNDGSCRFTDHAQELGLHDEWRSLHAAWVDFDFDGDLDLYLTNWADRRGEDEPGVPPEPHPDRFFLQGDDGLFVEISDQLPDDTQVSFGMSTAFFDLEGDGDLDLFQTNDRGAYFVPNRLFENEGQGDDGRWSFTDVTQERGFLYASDGMGLAFGDIDGDGDADIFNSGAGESMFVNHDGVFVDSLAALGLDPLEAHTLTWGGSLFDPDADGDVDVVHVESFFWDDGPELADLYRGPARYFRNDLDQTGQFVLQSFTGSFGQERHWRAEVTVDLNGDGFEDVLTSVVEDGPAVFFTNPPTGRGVVQVRLHGTRSNRDGRGAVVRLTTSRGEQIRWPGVVESYATAIPTWVTFGLGSDPTAGPLVVEWPSGAVQEIPEVPAGHVVHVTEPA